MWGHPSQASFKKKPAETRKSSRLTQLHPGLGISCSGLWYPPKNCWVLIPGQTFNKENSSTDVLPSANIFSYWNLGDLVASQLFYLLSGWNHFSCVFNILEDYFPQQILSQRQQIHSEPIRSFVILSSGDSEQVFVHLPSPMPLGGNYEEFGPKLQL